MNKLKFLCLSSLFASSVALAAPACDSFQIKLKNNLADDLLITNISLTNAEIQPSTFGELKSKAEQVFTVSRSNENLAMDGEFSLRTVSLPSKLVRIKYNLQNKLAVCEHTDYTPSGDYSVDKVRKVGEVAYSISNK